MKKHFYLLFWGLGFMMLALMPKASAQSQTHTITISQVFTNTASTTWTVPVGVTSVTVECYGGGGGGTKGKLDNATKYKNKPNGGGGGAYAASTFAVTAGTSYYICAGAGGAAGGDGSASWFSTNNKVDNAIVSAAGGGKGGNDAGGAGGTVANSKGDTKYAGGTGGTCTSSGTFYSGAGGGAAGPNGAGGNAADNIAGVGNGGRAGNGGAGGNSGTAQAGFEFGGGGSGGLGTAVGTEYAGGAGAQGAVLVTYDITYTVQDYEAVQGSVVSLNLGIESINGCEIHWYDQNHNEITTASTYSYIKGAAENDIYYVRLYDGTTPLTDEMQITVHLVGSSAPEGYSSVVASQIFNSTSSTTWEVPSGVTSVTVECYGGGGAGQKGKIKNGNIDGGNQGNGGGGGAYASSTLTVEPGTTYYLCAGQGGSNGAGNASWFGTKNGNNYTYIVSAAGGAAGAQNVPGAGGQASASIGTIRYSGGTGGMYTSSPFTSGAGGGAAGPNGNGHDANAAVGGTGNGGRAGNGANGVTDGVGLAGNTYGGGGSGSMCNNSDCLGGAGGNGVVSITYEVIYHVHDYESESGEWVDLDLGIASSNGCEIHWYDSHNNLLDIRGFYSYVKTTAPCDTFYVQLYDGANPLTEKQRILVRRICPEAPDGYTAMPIGESCWLMSNVPGSQDSLFTYDEVTSMDQNGCPYGWYLPSKAELQAAFDGLQETFIYPGYYRGATSAREGKGILEFFWTRDNLDTNSASRNDIAYVTDDCDQVMESPSITDNDAYSIRCVQDPNINTHYHLYKFAVSETDSVYFSQGNLQYLASNDSWKFATEQFDYIGNAAGNTTPMPERATQNNWIDLYGWGTSGWDNGNMYYHPYDVNVVTTSDGCYSTDDYGYGPVYCHCDTTVNNKGQQQIDCTEDHSNLDLTPNFTQWEGKTNGLEGVLTAEERAEYEKSDWGRYIGAEIINGGRTDWRTLTLTEWHFLMTQRDDAANKEAHATINGVKGIIFLPEFWDWNNCPNIPHFQTTHRYADNVYTMAQWRRLEYYGAMFLPAAGYRNTYGGGDNAHATTVNAAGEQGQYWASTAHPSSDGCAHPITFEDGSDIGTTASHTHDRAVGRCVRLVRNCDTDESGRLSNNQ